MSSSIPLVPTLLVLTAIATTTAADSDDNPLVVTAQGESLTTDTADSAARQNATVAGGSAVVAGDDMRRGRAVTLRDALASVPGVYVQPRLGAEESRLSIRGSGIQRTFHLRGITLLQDGQPINNADGGADFQAIDPGLMDHLTVHRGANALRYGAVSLGGAINFVSPTGRTAPGTMLRAEAGSFSYIKTVGTTAFVNGDVDVFVGLSAYTQEGYREHARQENQRAFANLGWRISDTVENRLYATYSNSNSELPGSLTKAQFEDDPEQAQGSAVTRDTKRDFPLIRLADKVAIDLGPALAEFGAGWMYKDLFHPLSFGLIDQDSNDVNGFARISSASNRVRYSAGINASYGVTDAKTWNYVGTAGHVANAQVSDQELTASNIEAYGEASIAIIEHTWLVLGLQAVSATRDAADNLEVVGDQSGDETYTALNPKAGILWEASDAVQVFANLSRSFEPPTFAEYNQANVAFGPSLPQSDLDAQSAWTAEIGTRGALEHATWDVAAYYAMVQDEYLSFDQGGGLAKTVNADDTLHVGVELGGGVRLIDEVFTSDDGLILEATYTFGRFTFADDGTFGDNVLPGMPQHFARAELRWERRQGLYVAMIAEWQDDWYVDYANTTEAEGELILGARLGYRTAKGLSAFIEGKNLADTEYAATTSIANPASAVAAADQQLWNPGDGFGVFAGIEWKQ